MVNETLPEVDFRFCPARAPTPPLCGGVFVNRASAQPISMATRSPKPFGDFVQRTRREKGLSCKDVEKKSARFGKSIAGSYVNRIENDSALKPTGVALKALAYGLGVPPEEVFLRAVGLFEPGIESEKLQLFSRFKELSPEKRGFILDLVDMLYSKEPSRKTPKRKPT